MHMPQSYLLYVSVQAACLRTPRSYCVAHLFNFNSVAYIGVYLTRVHLVVSGILQYCLCKGGGAYNSVFVCMRGGS